MGDLLRIYQHPSAQSAIDFALDKLQPYEIAEFLDEWRRGINLSPWYDAVHQDGTWQNFDDALSVGNRSVVDTGLEYGKRTTTVDTRLPTG